MSFLLRHAYRRARIPWQQQQQRQRQQPRLQFEIRGERPATLVATASSSRSLTTRSSDDDGRNDGSLPHSFVFASRPNSFGVVDFELENLSADFDSKLGLSPSSSLFVAASADALASSIVVPALSEERVHLLFHRQLPLPASLSPSPSPPPPLSLTPSSAPLGSIVDPSSSTSIAPPPLRRRGDKIDIREPAKTVSVVISDGRTNEKAVVGDQPSANGAQEIIGDRMGNLIKKEAIRILQIRRTKMNKHKLRKWRRKFKHLIKKKIEEKEKAEKKELDDAVAAIHGDADAFNPVDKVRRHVALAKEMGYRASYYENLPLTKWLKEKEAKGAANAVRFEDRNRERYRKNVPPWEYEKF